MEARLPNRPSDVLKYCHMHGYLNVCARIAVHSRPLALDQFQAWKNQLIRVMDFIPRLQMPQPMPNTLSHYLAIQERKIWRIPLLPSPRPPIVQMAVTQLDFEPSLIATQNRGLLVARLPPTLCSSRPHEKGFSTPSDWVHILAVAISMTKNMPVRAARKSPPSENSLAIPKQTQCACR